VNVAAAVVDVDVDADNGIEHDHPANMIVVEMDQRAMVAIQLPHQMG